MRVNKEINDRHPRIFRPENDGAESNGSGANGYTRKYGWVVVLDWMAEGQPERYPFFEEMKYMSFLRLYQFKLEKADEEKRQRDLQTMMNGRK